MPQADVILEGSSVMPVVVRAVEHGIPVTEMPPVSDADRGRLRELFHTDATETPVGSEFFDREAVAFMRKNFDRFLDDMTVFPDNGQAAGALRRMGIHVSTFSLMESDIRPDDQGAIDAGYDPDKDCWYFGHAAALAYMQENVRIDTAADVGETSSWMTNRRVFVRPLDRYIASNDYGMVQQKGYADLAYREEGDSAYESIGVDSPRGILHAMESAFGNIDRRLSHIIDPIQTRVIEEVNAQMGNRDETRAGWELRTMAINQRLIDAVRSHFVEHPGDRELVLTGKTFDDVLSVLELGNDEAERIDTISGWSRSEQSQAMREVYVRRTEELARSLGYLKGDAAEEYRRFRSGDTADVLPVFQDPTPEEIAGTTIPFVRCDVLQLTMLTTPDRYRDTNFGAVAYTMRRSIGNLLAVRAVETHDEEFRQVFGQLRSRLPVQNTQDIVDDFVLYDAMERFGATRVHEIVRAERIGRDMDALGHLERMGVDVRRMPAEELRSQIESFGRMADTGLFQYLYDRDAQTGQIPAGYFENTDWLDVVGPERARRYLAEAGRMLRFADAINTMHQQDTPSRQRDMFPNPDMFTSRHWELYDLSKTGVDDDLLLRHLQQEGNLIFRVAYWGGAEEFVSGLELHGEDAERFPRTTVARIIERMEAGHDISAILFTHNQEEFARRFVLGDPPTAQDIMDIEWNASMREGVTAKEVAAFRENADWLTAYDPERVYQYARWHNHEHDPFWKTLVADMPTDRAGIMFRMQVGFQDGQNRIWFKALSNTVGTDLAWRFMTEGYGEDAKNWHDALYWHRDLARVGEANAKALLHEVWGDSVKVDDLRTAVPQYSATDDPNATEPIGSLRELHKRIDFIRTNFDPGVMPEHVRHIVEAPGFRMSVYTKLMETPEFRALQRGEYDEGQPFAPHTRVFCERSLTEALRAGLGSRKNGVVGTAKDPEQLFGRLARLTKGKTGKDGKPLSVQHLLSDVPVWMEEDVIRLLQAQGVDVGAIIEAKLLPKSDPDGWVCGNWTDCCMEFEDAKNNRVPDGYMFNRATQYFIITYNGRTVAQSVAVDAANTTGGSDVVILDNIEVAKNYKDKLSPVIAKAYRVFWSEYTPKPVKIGTANSDLTIPGSVLENNTYQPKQPLAYTDADGPMIYDLPKLAGEVAGADVLFSNLDVREVAVIDGMERMIYPPDMVVGWAHDLYERSRQEHVSGAMGSFVARVGKRPAGYALVLPTVSEAVPGTRAIHVWDMAVLPEFRNTRCAEAMFDRILASAAAGRMHLEMEARESTSYRVLSSRLMRKRLEARGFFLTHDRTLPAYMGDEDFHFLRFEYRGRRT